MFPILCIFFLLRLSSETTLVQGLHIDGKNQYLALKKNQRVRDDLVIEMMEPENTHDKIQSWAYMKEEGGSRYKILMGHVRDPNWYWEPRQDWLATSDTSELPRMFERTMKLTSHIWGLGPVDSRPNRVLSMATLYNYNKHKIGNITAVFDVKNDPLEKYNLCKKDKQLCSKMVDLLLQQRNNRRTDVVPEKYWEGDPNIKAIGERCMETGRDEITCREEEKEGIFTRGDCSKAEQLTQDGALPSYGEYDYDKSYMKISCQFIHPWQR